MNNIQLISLTLLGGCYLAPISFLAKNYNIWLGVALGLLQSLLVVVAFDTFSTNEREKTIIAYEQGRRAAIQNRLD